MDIENGIDCQFDWLKVFNLLTFLLHSSNIFLSMLKLQIVDIDGNFSTKYCGGVLPASSTFEATVVEIRFHSDRFVERRGFKLRYKIYTNSTPGKPTTVWQRITDLDNCMLQMHTLSTRPSLQSNGAVTSCLALVVHTTD
jgi:hypothetical protein